MAQSTKIVFLIEDEAAAAAEISRTLSELGVTIWHAETGADARAVLKDARPDLIVIDLTLPDVDGLVLCANLNNDAPGVPFMVCSTGTTAEKVLSFKLGAEDFVSKPFEAAELQARVEAILARRARQSASTRPASDEAAAASRANGGPDLGRLRVDLARWRVTIDDKPLNLTPTEFQLLVFMAQRPGEIISRQELARGVWGNESMSRSRTIDAYVRRIAGKLSVSQQTQDDWPPRILNIRGLGYQLSVPHVSAA
jgi:two-component system alkaline phosphatase synthesis response regulator PhoP